MRLRELGLTVGSGTPGPLNAITDVAGVMVGHTTLISGAGPLDPGRGPVRTGVTVVRPVPGYIRETPLCAGVHTLNGNGELTGMAWIAESGLLTTPIAITNTHSVGVVRDALAGIDSREGRSRTGGRGLYWSMPAVARPTTACSTTSRARTFVPSMSRPRMTRQLAARWPRAASAAAPG